MSCKLPVPFPGCINVTSLLASVVWVYGPTNACFDPHVPNCTMPAPNMAVIDGMFPVNTTGTVPSSAQASATGEIWINATGIGVPNNATTVLLGAGANGADLGTIRHSLTMVAIESGVEIEALTLAAPKIELQGFTVINLTALPGVDLPGLKLSGMKTGYPLRLSATPARGVIDLDGSSFDASTVAILRHKGTVTCTGETLCVTLEGNDRRAIRGVTQREGSALVASIDALTAVFGENYIVEFIDDQDVFNGVAARQIAAELAWWTVAAALSVLLAHGDKLFGSF